MTKFKRITTGIIAPITILAVLPLDANAEWKQDNTGWRYSKGSSYSTSWANINGQWYYFNSNGYMKTGWVNDSGNWYYFNGDGIMAHDTTIDGYHLNSNGTINSNQASVSSGTWSCH